MRSISFDAATVVRPRASQLCPCCTFERRPDRDLSMTLRWQCTVCDAWGFSKVGGGPKPYPRGEIPTSDRHNEREASVRDRHRTERELTREGWRP